MAAARICFEFWLPVSIDYVCLIGKNEKLLIVQVGKALK